MQGRLYIMKVPVVSAPWYHKMMERMPKMENHTAFVVHK